eukprot:gene8546-5993_t
MAWPISRVRQTFIDFFVQKKAHTFWRTSPVVPLNDPTLLFINAGMNQFKDIFLGTADPQTEFGKLHRAANSQLCIRAGGKHNDLDDVGNDTYHHTFFEMLGCWSFGDYFKKEIIPWSWELLTEVYGIPADQLYVTYFEGNPALGLEPDLETKQMWEKLVPASHIIPGNAKDNFWEMGDTGPCGPCTEIHFDRVGGRNAADLVNKDDPMVIEVWNLVFIEFERRSAKELVKLPKQHVDTGMGLERLTSVLQGVTSNYDTDAWTPLFEAIQKVTGCPTCYAAVRHEVHNDITVAYRVVADHIRCLTMALADGAVPDSVGRGFVLRRIIRRAVRFGVQFLNQPKPGFFSALVDAVVESLGGFYSHLTDPRTVQRVKAILLEEETSFAKTWSTGLKHFQKAVEESRHRAERDKSKPKKIVISGQDAFILHDRYGFPVDLTYLLAQKEGLEVDMEGFQETMKSSQVSAGRVAAAKTYLDVHQIEELKRRNAPPTDDSPKYTWEEITSDILAIYDKRQNKFVDLLPNDCNGGDEDFAIILARTNFYAEAGGQIYDTGLLVAMEDAVFAVRKVYNIGGYIAHVGNFLKEAAACPIPSCAQLQLKVDYNRRSKIASNHTATHQLNWVLRRVLQDNKPDQFFEVNQKGSLVTEDLLRFDFSYPSKLTNEELQDIETLLNEKMATDLEVFREEVPLETAKRIAGCRHMFGEKYPDPVCVVSVGVPVEDLTSDPENERWREFAIEFCGGTHLEMLCEAQQAAILSEEALMKGVRRLVVVTRDAARAAIAAGNQLATEVQDLVDAPVTPASVKSLSVLNKKVNDSSIPLLYKAQLRDRIDAAIKLRNGQLKALAAEAKEKAAAAGKQRGVEAAESRGEDVPLLLTVAPEGLGADREALQAFAEGFISTAGPLSGIFVAGVDPGDDSKGLAVVQLSADLVSKKKLSAVNWAKAAIGKGGGKPQAAQSGFGGAAQMASVVQKAAAEAEAMAK